MAVQVVYSGSDLRKHGEQEGSGMGEGKANAGALMRGLALWPYGAQAQGVLRLEEHPSVLFSWN